MTNFASPIWVLGQVQSRLQFQWPLPTWWFGLIAVVLAITIVTIVKSSHATILQKSTLLTCRLLAMVVLVVMLPGWSLLQEKTGKPKLIVLVDTSLSMEYPDKHSLKPLMPLANWVFDPHGIDPILMLDEAQGDVIVDLVRMELSHAFLNGDLSMSGPAIKDQQQRFPLMGALKGVEDEYDIHLYGVNDVVKPLTYRENGSVDVNADLTVVPRSAIGTGILEVLRRHRGQSIAGIVLLTDGRVNRGASLKQAGEVARQASVPLIIPQVFGRSDAKDFELVQPNAPISVFVDEPAVFEIDVLRHGNLESELQIPFQVSDGESDYVIHAEFQPGKRETQLSMKYVSSEPGPKTLQVEHLSENGDSWGHPAYSYFAKRSHEFQFEVKDDAVNVLLIEESPRFEYRALEDLFQRATNKAGRKKFDVSSVLGSVAPQLAQENPNVYSVIPKDKDWLFGFDVIVIGDVSPQLLNLELQEMLVEYVVQRGGGLAMLAGEQYLPLSYEGEPLEQLLPAGVERFQVVEQSARPASFVLSKLGRRSKIMSLEESVDENIDIWSQLNGPYWYLKTPALKTGVRVLTFAESEEADQVPMITQQFAGAGRVVFHGFDSSWRWQRQGSSGDAFSHYWTQMMRFLAGASVGDGKAGIEISVQSRQVEFGEDNRIYVRYLDPQQAPPEDNVVVQLTKNRLQSQIVRLSRDGIQQGVFTGAIGGLQLGKYVIEFVNPLQGSTKPKSVNFYVSTGDPEAEYLEADEDGLRQLATSTGGKFYDLEDWGRVLEELPDGRQVVVQKISERRLWNNHWFIGLFLSLMSLEWWLRRRWYN